jgi:hypothetical protein
MKIKAVILYGCETLCITWLEENGLKVCENRTVMRMFGLMREKRQEIGEKCIMRNFVTYTPLQVLLG